MILYKFYRVCEPVRVLCEFDRASGVYYRGLN